MYLHREFIIAHHVPTSTSGYEVLPESNKELAIARGRALRAEAFGKLIEAVGAALFAVPRRMLARKATANALRQLDPHMLRDIGIEPGGIEGAIERAHGETGPGLVARTLSALARMAARVRVPSTIAALYRTDPRRLADIGIEKGDIALLAEQAHGLASAPKAKPEVLVAANDEPRTEREVA